MSVTLRVARPRYQRTVLSAAADPSGQLNNNLQLVQSAIAGSSAGDVQAVTTAYTALATDGAVLADATAGPFTVTLPSASVVAGQRLTVKKIDSSVGVVTVGATVDGTANPTLATQYKSVTVVSDGSTWWQIAST